MLDKRLDHGGSVFDRRSGLEGFGRRKNIAPISAHLGTQAPDLIFNRVWRTELDGALAFWRCLPQIPDYTVPAVFRDDGSVVERYPVGSFLLSLLLLSLYYMIIRFCT